MQSLKCMASDPVLIAYSVSRNKKTGRPNWTEIGKAYPHEVGAGLTVVLKLMPMDGRIVLLELDETDRDRFIPVDDLVKARGKKSGAGKAKVK
ncbi:MAG: hypothetical protein R3D44_10010 [Hyphomicrobiaceae bacterium]